MSHAKQQYSILQIALNFTAASILSGAILAGTYFVTAPLAQKQRIELKNQSMRELISGAKKFEPFNSVGSAEDPSADWYRAQDAQGKLLGFILPAEGRGYGGAIRILVAADPEGKIIDYKILAHNETPGLGDRTALSSFRQQFQGKKAANLEVVKNHDATKIDAITGATISSRAVTRAIKLSLEELASVQKTQKKQGKK